jgi:hypothetical protein
VSNCLPCVSIWGTLSPYTMLSECKIMMISLY